MSVLFAAVARAPRTTPAKRLVSEVWHRNGSLWNLVAFKARGLKRVHRESRKLRDHKG